MTIGVMWLNHHRLFTLINRRDDELIAFNLLLLLLGITWLPFPTALLAEHPRSTHLDQQVATVVYAGSFFVIAIVFNVMWRYAIRVGIVEDHVNVVIAFFGAKWCLGLSILYALYFALPPSLWTRRASSA